MELIWQAILVLCGGMFSGAVITSVLFYRQKKRGMQASAGLNEATADETRAKTDILTVTALGDAIELLSKENKRLSVRQTALQKELRQLRKEVHGTLEDNELLAGRLEKMRVILLDFQKGILMLTRQVVEAQLEPVYTIPGHITKLLKQEPPLFKGRGET